MKSKTFLTRGITRKQYVLLYILGLLIAPIAFIAAIYIALYFSNVLGNQTIGVIIGMLSFVLIGAYFYIIKMKRLRDIGKGNDTLLISHMIPLGDIALSALLFGKKTQKSAKKSSKKEIMSIVLIFILLYLLYFGLYTILNNYGK